MLPEATGDDNVSSIGRASSAAAAFCSASAGVGWSRGQVDRKFTTCRIAGHVGNSEGVKNEESEYHPDIFVCGPPKVGWPQFWKENQRFG